MKAVINSNSLIEISKLIKADEFSVVVKDEDVKIIGTNTYENESYINKLLLKKIAMEMRKMDIKQFQEMLYSYFLKIQL